MTNKQKLIDLIKTEALEVKPPGEFFTLKSGAKSRYYLDLRKITLSTTGLDLILSTIADFLGALPDKNKKFIKAIGGPSIGADPIVGGLLAQIGWTKETPLRGFLVRPQAKDHGKGGRIIGSVRPGDKCLLVEDVTTTGGSLADAADQLALFGAVPILSVVIVNRNPNLKELMFWNNMEGIPLHALITAEELGITEDL